jgi:hypothetical protein
LLQEVGVYGPNYKSPTPEVLGGKLMLDEKVKIEQALVPIKENWKNYGCSLIADGWTDVRRRPLQGIVVNSKGISFFVKAFDGSGKPKTAENLLDMWNDAISYIGVENIVQFVTDSEASNKRAGQLLEQAHPTIFWTPCVAHGLNNLMKDIGAYDWIAPTLSRAKDVVVFIYRHHFSLALFRQIAKKELLKYAETRFAYNFLMLQRMIQLQLPLQQLVVSEDWNAWDGSKSTEGQAVRSTVLCDVSSSFSIH